MKRNKNELFAAIGTGTLIVTVEIFDAVETYVANWIARAAFRHRSSY